MTKKESIKNINFGLHRFKVVSFKKNDSLKKIDTSNFGYQFNLEFQADQDNKLITIELKITAQQGEDAKFILGQIETKTSFFVNEMESFFDGNDLFSIPDSLAITLFSISLSTSRGAMAVKSEGHLLEDYPVPLVNPADIYQKFKELNNAHNKNINS